MMHRERIREETRPGLCFESALSIGSSLVVAGLECHASNCLTTGHAIAPSSVWVRVVICYRIGESAEKPSIVVIERHGIVIAVLQNDWVRKEK